MNPLMTWIAENLELVLAGGLALGAVALLTGAVGAWRAARHLRRRPRPLGRLAFSLLLLVAGGFACLFFGTGLAQVGPGLRAQRAMLGKPAPELAFRLVETDGPGRLADHRGQVVLLNVWATWCPPCIAEMPALDRLQADYRDRGLVVLHLSDEDRSTLVDWLGRHEARTLHAYAQPLPWPESGRPTSFVVDRDGVVRRVLIGARSYEQFVREIEPHL